MNTQRVQIKEIKNNKVHYQDLTHVTTTDEVIKTLTLLNEMLQKEPENSALILTDVEGFEIHRDALSRFRDLIKANRPYIKKSAVGNVSNAQQNSGQLYADDQRQKRHKNVCYHGRSRKMAVLVKIV